MILSGPKRIRLEGPFPDSTLRGNQVQVALVIYLFWLGNNRRETDVACVNNNMSSVYLSECTVYRLSIRYRQIRIQRDGVLLDLLYLE